MKDTQVSLTHPDARSLIIGMMERPVNDLYAIDERIKIVETVPERKEVKTLVLKSLEIARSKNE
ncbi:MAG: hypothetical protein ACI81P_000644 [Neolewinella sp.]